MNGLNKGERFNYEKWLIIISKIRSTQSLLAGGIMIGGASTLEAATFYGDVATIVTDDSSVYYTDYGTARMYLTESYDNVSHTYLVKLNPNETRAYILNGNGRKQLDAYGRYIMVGYYKAVKQMCQYYF